MFKFLEKLFGSGNNDEIAELIENGAIIVDVRTAFEFNREHFHDSINIPLDAIDKHIKKLKRSNKPIITCCRSGQRSGVAKSILNARGIESYNGGSWRNVKKVAGLKVVK